MQSFLLAGNLKHTATNESILLVQISVMVSTMFVDVNNDGKVMIITMTITSPEARVAVIASGLVVLSLKLRGKMISLMHVCLSVTILTQILLNIFA